MKDTNHSSVRSTGSPYKYQTISTSAWFGKKEVNSPRSALILWQIISWFKLKQHKGLWTPTSCSPCELALNPTQSEGKDLGGGSGANGPFTFTVCERFLLEKQFLLSLPIWCKLTEQGSTRTHKQERSCGRHRQHCIPQQNLPNALQLGAAGGRDVFALLCSPQMSTCNDPFVTFGPELSERSKKWA